MSTSKIPTLTNWGEVDTSVFYKGVEVVKANKTTIIPKDGAEPQFFYKNRAGIVGSWYSVKDVSKVDKTMQAENKRFANDLQKKVLSGEIDASKMQEVLQALGLSV